MLANAAELILLLNLRLCSIQKNIHQQNNQHDMPTLIQYDSPKMHRNFFKGQKSS
jgi:hypothetical protein